MTELSAKLGQYVLRDGSKLVATVPKGAKVMFHNKQAYFFHKDYPASWVDFNRLIEAEPHELADWVKILTPIVLT